MKHWRSHIVDLYSTTPHNIAELKKGLDDYGFDEKTKASILDAVTKKIDEAKKAKPRQPPAQPGKTAVDAKTPIAPPIPAKDSGE